jgi:hypothetical protein
MVSLAGADGGTETKRPQAVDVHAPWGRREVVLLISLAVHARPESREVQANSLRLTAYQFQSEKHHYNHKADKGKRRWESDGRAILHLRSFPKTRNAKTIAIARETAMSASTKYIWRARKGHESPARGWDAPPGSKRGWFATIVFRPAKATPTSLSWQQLSAQVLVQRVPAAHSGSSIRSECS